MKIVGGWDYYSIKIYYFGKVLKCTPSVPPNCLRTLIVRILRLFIKYSSIMFFQFFLFLNKSLNVKFLFRDFFLKKKTIKKLYFIGVSKYVSECNVKNLLGQKEYKIEWDTKKESV